MATLLPPEDDNENRIIKSASWPEPNTDNLSMEQNFELIKKQGLIASIFREAREKVGALNKEQVLWELQSCMQNLVGDLLVANFTLKDIAKQQMLKDIPSGSSVWKIPQPTEDDVKRLKQEYGEGEMQWSKDENGEAILELRLEGHTQWSPHTDEKWDDLLSKSIRSSSMPRDTSNGFPEFNFLRNVLNWKIKKGN